MSSYRSDFGSITLLAAGLGLCLAGCGSNDVPTGISGNDRPAAEVTAALPFGPFPGKTTIFVDVDNTSGLEDGSQSRPFNSIRDALAVAKNGDVVGVAPGVYAETFPQGGPNYVIDGLKNFALLGSGPKRTTIRGDHSFSLIRVQNGASAIIRGFTIEHGGQIRHSEGGGIQVLGRLDSVTLTVSNVILRDNEAVNGAAIEADGRASLQLFNVLIARNRSSNCCSVLLRGEKVYASFKHTTITQNAASFHAGGVVVEARSRLDLVNSIVWGNTLADAVTSDGARLIAAFSDVGGVLLPGRGNLSVDPRFVDPGNHDFRLRLNSPAVDAGNNVRGVSTDLFGHPRPVDGDGDGVAVIDMGAFERLAKP